MDMSDHAREETSRDVVVFPKVPDLEDRALRHAPPSSISRQRWHRTRQPSADLLERGRRPVAQALHGEGAARMKAAALGQHGEVRHRAGDRLDLATLPAEMRTRGDQRLGVGHARPRKDLPDRTFLDDLARVHDEHSRGDLAHEAEIVGHEQDRHRGLLLDRLQQVDDLGLDRHIERGRRLVGNQERRLPAQRHGNHARWRMPPESWCG